MLLNVLRRRVAMLSLLALTLSPVGAAAAQPLPPMPEALVNSGVATDGEDVYLFGGFFKGDAGREPSADVLRLDPREGRIEKVAELPSPRMGASAVWTGEAFLVVGGLGKTGALDEVVHVDPRTRAVRLDPTRLPAGIYNAGTAWNGTHLLVLGGIEDCPHGCVRLSRSIVVFEPVTGTLRVAEARLPYGLAAPAFDDGEGVYLVGGLLDPEAGGGFSDRILRYSPSKDRLETLPMRLPQPLMGMGLAWDGTRAFLLGGESSLGAMTSHVLAFTPATGDVQRADADLPEPRSASAVALVGGRAYILGGLGCPDARTACDTILSWDAGQARLLPLPQEAPSGAGAHRALPAMPLALLVGVAAVAALARRPERGA